MVRVDDGGCKRGLAEFRYSSKNRRSTSRPPGLKIAFTGNIRGPPKRTYYNVRPAAIPPLKCIVIIVCEAVYPVHERSNLVN